MIKLLDKWLFVNYCGQKIGQFSGSDLRDSLLTVLVAQVVPFFNLLIVILYILVGFRNFYVLLILMVFIAYCTRLFLESFLKEYLLLNRLESKYKAISRKNRILNFVFSILLTGGAVVIFGCGLSMLKWF
jgi:hypothetical protein